MSHFGGKNMHLGVEVSYFGGKNTHLGIEVSYFEVKNIPDITKECLFGGKNTVYSALVSLNDDKISIQGPHRLPQRRLLFMSIRQDRAMVQ